MTEVEIQMDMKKRMVMEMASSTNLHLWPFHQDPFRYDRWFLCWVSVDVCCLSCIIAANLLFQRQEPNMSAMVHLETTRTSRCPAEMRTENNISVVSQTLCQAVFLCSVFFCAKF